jgi:hypothetical protein
MPAAMHRLRGLRVMSSALVVAELTIRAQVGRVLV